MSAIILPVIIDVIMVSSSNGNFFLATGPLVASIHYADGNFYFKMPSSLEAVRSEFRLFQSLWNLIGTSTAAAEIQYDH